MATLPYVTAPGNVTKALETIISAATPEKVTQDFVKEILQIPGGSGNQMTAYLKKIGMVGADGSPTDIYKKFRNSSTRGLAAAQALRYGYEPLYERNEYVHTVSDAKLKGLVVEITGASEDSSSAGLIVSCFKNVKAFAEFNVQQEDGKEQVQVVNSGASPAPAQSLAEFVPPPSAAMGLNLSYTINLNLPATSDIAVFNAIFKSLKENLLRSSDE